jgi:hypothetical protein
MTWNPAALHLLGAAGEGGAETYFIDLVRPCMGAGVDEAARSAPMRAARRR